jgi:predicted RNA-binding protein with PUA-like domain
MRILIDTNIFIYREDPNILPENLQKLLRIINENGHVILVHPASIEDIENDKDVTRKKIMKSKLKSYVTLESPPVPDEEFLITINAKNSKHDPDNHILYSLFRNCVNILISEDKEIHRKALKINLEDRVFDIDSALTYFVNLHERKFSHVLLKEDYMYNININDPIFTSLKEEYVEFEEWFKKISTEGRKCWIYSENEEIRAILIYKEENESLDIPPLPKRKRFKISTLKVDLIGYKIGELLLKLAFKYCTEHEINEIYLTHFFKEEDYLIDLITQFGFDSVGKNQRGEIVYIKKLIPENNKDINPIKMSKKYYPSFKDGEYICKFLIPIRPQYHSLLFQDYEKRQMKITEYMQFNIQGNTIKKAYLSHSKVRKIHPGDLILFYRSSDQKCITSLGIVEEIHLRLTDVDEILHIIGKRSVYTYDEIVELSTIPVMIIIFRHHFHFRNPIKLNHLIEQNLLRSAPQSIMEISNDKYQKIKQVGGIPERFTFD